MMPKRDYFNFYSAGRIVFGSGVTARLSQFIQPWAPKKALIVTDAVLVRIGLVNEIERPLRDAGIEVDIFDGGEPEPSFAVADRALAKANASKPDLVIGVGGGSNLDLAKIVACVLSHGGGYRDYFGYGKVPGPIMPLVCLPTTAGTGSEVSHAAVLTDTENQVKISSLSHYLRPALAVVDPKLTLSCPPQASADSGIDALTHAIEAFTAMSFDQLAVPPDEPFPYDGKQPIGDCLAERAIELIGKHLITAVKEPSDLVAREGMALAATLAGLAFSNNAVAVVHALEYPIGGALHCSHGAGNGLLLPYVMKFNLPARIPEFKRIAELLGENVSGLSDLAAAERAVTAVERLRVDAGIPLRIRDLGGTRDQLPLFAKKSFAIQRLMILNGRTPTEADLLSILESAF
ncbi:iron-containing alcohol dehydrogenase [Schlesneria paludicola]|uniref:iron-containing alcohol dehydrogenase n=1 Tax=Schlesneria paludicola TaxID=360056 RepID=UPI00029B1CFD|nr:iron-containing alcohol dehydrogenase [Schlesneria paludicola]